MLRIELNQLRKGDIIYHTETGKEYHFVSFDPTEPCIIARADGMFTEIYLDKVTSKKPVKILTKKKSKE